ncbi:MAG: DUF423 domain-containing protein [Alphaproteobacteria bacterium]|nr:DUF423 domain-containing protein [Alphaproteobacteria bacterium]
MHRSWIVLGALAGLTGVGMAAYAAHAALDPDARRLLASAVDIELWHAPVLLICGVWATRLPRTPLIHAAGATLSLGVLAFSGALYCLALTGSTLPRLAPTGGVLLMLGWVLLGLAALRA